MMEISSVQIPHGAKILGFVVNFTYQLARWSNEYSLGPTVHRELWSLQGAISGYILPPPPRFFFFKLCVNFSF